MDGVRDNPQQATDTTSGDVDKTVRWTVLADHRPVLVVRDPSASGGVLVAPADPSRFRAQDGTLQCLCGWRPRYIPREAPDDQLAKHVEYELSVAMSDHRHHQELIKQHGPGLVACLECTICGWLEWQSTTDVPAGSESRVQIAPMVGGQGSSCAACAEVQKRSPEVFRWVVGVIVKQGRTARRFRL